MTNTIQPICASTIDNDCETKAVENNVNDSLNGLLEVCNSLNILCETLSRLESAVRKQVSETNLTQNSGAKAPKL